MARALRVLAFWLFVLAPLAHLPFLYSEVVPGRGRPRMDNLVIEVPVLAAVGAWAIAAAWGGFLRRNRALLAAGFILLALYSVALVRFSSFGSRGIVVAPGLGAYLAVLWLAALAGTWGATRDAASGLAVRGWSPRVAAAAVFLSLIAAAHVSFLTLVPVRGGSFLEVVPPGQRWPRWLTADIVWGFAGYAALAALVAGLAWAGLAFRRGWARAALVAALLAYSAAIIALWPWPDPRYVVADPAAWPLLVGLGAVWAVAGAGLLPSRRRD